MQSYFAFFNRPAVLPAVSGLILLMLSACSDVSPSSQVLASVDGDDITTAELEHERDQSGAPRHADISKTLLDAMVKRRVLAQVSEQMGLEQDTGYHLELRRVREQLLVEVLYRRLEGTVDDPSADRVAQFINDHPWRFDKRRVLYLSHTPEGTTSDIVADTQAFPTPPGFPIMTIRAGEHMLWEGKVRHVIETQEIPFGGELARSWASNHLKSQAVERELAKLYQDALESGRLQYAPGYGPSGIRERRRN